jgi:hypothetical protein
MIETSSLVLLASVALIGAHFMNGMWLSWRKEVETKSPVAPLSMSGWRGWDGWVVLWIETGGGGEVPGVLGVMVPADTRSSTGPCLLPAMQAWLERMGSWWRGVQGDGRHLKHPPCLESRSRSSGVSFLGMDDRVWTVSSSMGVAVEAGGVGGLQWCRWRLFGVLVAL